MSERHQRWGMLALAAASIALGAAAWRGNSPIANDGILYIGMADSISRGQGIRNIFGAVETVFPPGFPAAISSVAHVAGGAEPAARLTVMAAAALLPVMLALVVARFCAASAGLAAGVLCLLYPLHFFIARGVWSEPLFFDLVLLMLLLNPSRPLKTNAALGAVLRGVLGGLAYYVRPEGLVVFAASEAVGAFRRPARKALAVAAVAFLALALAVTPYVLFLRHHTGQWTLTGKIAVNTALAERMSGGNVWQEPGREEVPAGRAGLLQTASRYSRNAYKVQSMLMDTLALGGVLLAGVGLAAAILDKRVKLLFLCAAIASPVVLLPFFFVVETRLVFSLCLGALPLIAYGALFLWKVDPGVRRLAHLNPARGVLLALLLLGGGAWARDFHDAASGRYDRGIVRRALGTRLRPVLQGQRLMAISLQTPYYARARYAGFPPGADLKAVLRYAREAGIRFMEVCTYDGEAFGPGLLDLIRKGGDGDGVVERAREVSPFGEVFAIFEIRKVGDGTP